MPAHAFIMRDTMAWCSQRGVAQAKITVALFAQPGTTLMRPASNAQIPGHVGHRIRHSSETEAARTTGAGCIINNFDAGVISGQAP